MKNWFNKDLLLRKTVDYQPLPSFLSLFPTHSMEWNPQPSPSKVCLPLCRQYRRILEVSKYGHPNLTDLLSRDLIGPSMTTATKDYGTFTSILIVLLGA